VQRDPKLRLGVVIAPVTLVLEFPDQWGPTSPGVIAGCGWPRTWRSTGRRYSRWSGSALGSRRARSSPGASISPAAEAFPYDPPGQAPAAEAGYPHGFEAGD